MFNHVIDLTDYFIEKVCICVSATKRKKALMIAEGAHTAVRYMQNAHLAQDLSRSIPHIAYGISWP